MSRLREMTHMYSRRDRMYDMACMLRGMLKDNQGTITFSSNKEQHVLHGDEGVIAKYPATVTHDVSLGKDSLGVEILSLALHHMENEINAMDDVIKETEEMLQ